VLRSLVASAFGLVVALAGASCTSQTIDASSCDYVVTRCRTVCDYYSCGYYYYGACCYNQCWYECIGDGQPDQPAAPPAPSAPRPGSPAEDAGSAPTPSDPSAVDGPGVLCSPCQSNDECKAGALCIQPGGVDADGGAATPRASFCGHACRSGADCPAGFTCEAIGSSLQCVPEGGGDCR